MANTIAYGFTALLLKRSILTEKIARRGFHMSREYSVDPLEILFVREVMRTSLVAFPESQTLGELAASFSPLTGNFPARPGIYIPLWEPMPPLSAS